MTRNRITGTGMPKIFPFPTSFKKKLSPRLEIGLPSMKIMVRPRYTVIVIRVAINGWSRPLVTRRPLIRPNPVPITSARSMARPTGIPFVIKLAQNAVVKASTEPTERSIPPVSMTQVMPNAINPLIDDCRSSDKKLLTVRNSGLMMLIITARRTSAINAPNS